MNIKQFIIAQVVEGGLDVIGTCETKEEALAVKRSLEAWKESNVIVFMKVL